MRGAHLEEPFELKDIRIIPADAGSTYSLSDGHLPSSGSSPRMRGAHRWGANETTENRIIPADAGST